MCVCVCACVRVWCASNTLRLCILSKVLCIHFVDLVKRGVVTFVSEIRRCRNDRYYYNYYYYNYYYHYYYNYYYLYVYNVARSCTAQPFLPFLKPLSPICFSSSSRPPLPFLLASHCTTSKNSVGFRSDNRPQTIAFSSAS